MFATYSSKIIALKNKGTNQTQKFHFETLYESKGLEEIKLFLLKNIDQIIEQNWGKFSKEFIVQHILKAQIVKLVRDKNEIIALAAASNKKIFNLNILYLEFTVINQDYQGYNLSTILNAQIIIEQYLKGFFKRRFHALDIVTITRNLRVLGALSHFASYIYPDPKEFENAGKIKPSNERTWKIVNEILRISWNPNRKLLKEGNVLIGSYENTPWLIQHNIQKHYKTSVKDLGEKYLDLKKFADKEFIVHVRYNILSILKYFFWTFYKILSSYKDA
ncbi:MAG: hypothetical protein WC544_04260 [Patescibacteria group bacterium]